MPSPSRHPHPHAVLPSPRGRTAALLAGLLAGSLLLAIPATATGASASAPAPAPAASVAPVASVSADPVPVRITQANLRSGQPARKFEQDLRRVFAGTPDFITYNEVTFRPDALLAPTGYEVWRTPGRYSGATPVAWRSDRWTRQAQGTVNLANRKGRGKGHKVQWGIRFANWVTLVGAGGERISVVSAHLPPKHKITKGLAAQSIRRLGKLTRSLRAAGPVLIGGDFNMHYPSRDYLRGELTAAGITPTYDVLGTYPPTGDHFGATIDYVFMSPVTQFNVVGQRTTELKSDHDALTVDLTFVPTGGDQVQFVRGPRSNLPSGNRAARRGVLDLMVAAIDNAPRGAGVHLVTTKLADGKTYRALNRARKRGVKVQFITRTHRPNNKEKKLFRRLKGRVKTRAFAVKCSGPCRRIEQRRRLPKTSLLVSTAGSTRALRIDSDRAAAFRSSKSLTRAQVKTSKRSYDNGFRLFLRLVGRKM